jgi:hypothetical protein
LTAISLAVAAGLRGSIAQKDGKIIELLSLLHYVDEGHASFEGVR